jgi:hypothetical protein
MKDDQARLLPGLAGKEEYGRKGSQPCLVKCMY